MKPNAMLLSAGLALACAHHVAAQGSLTPPPGAPGPVMKSLDQIEARTPISSAPFTIIKPGSYYLTQDLQVASGNAITINASGVTLDLNGFTISTTAATPTGVGIFFTDGQKDISITNGHIQGSIVYDSGTGSYSGGGFSVAMSAPTIVPQNVLISHMTISGCGTGINIGSGAVAVRFCAVRGISVGSGIVARTVDQCTVSECGAGGISAHVVANSYSTVTGNGDAIFATEVVNCFGTSASGKGINCTAAANSTGLSTSGVGLQADTAHNSYGRTTSGTPGMNVVGTASFCRGRSDLVGGVAIQAGIAVACTAQAGTISSPQKHLGTP